MRAVVVFTFSLPTLIILRQSKNLAVAPSKCLLHAYYYKKYNTSLFATLSYCKSLAEFRIGFVPPPNRVGANSGTLLVPVAAIYCAGIVVSWRVYTGIMEGALLYMRGETVT